MGIRGYFGIGIENLKRDTNLGTLWRSAYCFDADFMFTIGQRYRRQSSDTVSAWKHVPLYQYATFDAFLDAIPYDCQIIGIEIDQAATPLERFQHPERAIYLLGAEDVGLSNRAKTRCVKLIQMDSRQCLNVAVAGSIVMWHRSVKRAREERIHEHETKRRAVIA